MECNGHTVSTHTHSTGVHCPHWLAQRSCHCSHIHISSPLSLSARLHRCCANTLWCCILVILQWLNFFWTDLCTYTERDLLYRTTAHDFGGWKVLRSQDLQGEMISWRLRRTNCIVLVPKLAGLRPGRSQCFHWSFKAGRNPSSARSTSLLLGGRSAF